MDTGIRTSLCFALFLIVSAIIVVIL
jgi:hypothetical protein